MFKNLVASAFMTLGFFLFFRNLDILIKTIKSNRKYKKTCRQIGWKPQFTFLPRLRNRI